MGTKFCSRSQRLSLCMHLNCSCLDSSGWSVWAVSRRADLSSPPPPVSHRIHLCIALQHIASEFAALHYIAHQHCTVECCSRLYENTRHPKQCLSLAFMEWTASLLYQFIEWTVLTIIHFHCNVFIPLPSSLHTSVIIVRDSELPSIFKFFKTV